MSETQSHPGEQKENSRATAESLRKAGEFVEAAAVYESIWPDGDPRTGWGYALCLRKLKKTEDALSVATAVFQLAPDFELGHSVYAWALFDSFVRGADDLSQEVTERAELIVKLTAKSERAYEGVSPFVPTVIRVARLLADKGRHKQVLRWLEHLDPDRLRGDEYPFVDHDGKHRRLASHRERYHSLRTHALEKEGRWEECLTEAQLALTACAPLHHDNDIWFARRVARAKMHLGKCDEAIQELSILAARKPASFIYFDIAEAALKLENYESAFSNCLLAVQSPGEIGYKLAALLLLARLLWREGKQVEARQHLALYIAYRRDNSWRIDANVKALAKEWDVGSDGDVTSLLRHLKAVWREWTKSDEKRRSGIVQSVLPHGRAGFIIAGDRERFFFDTRDWKDKRYKPIEGSRVTFITRPSFDRKHQKPSVVACEIEMADRK